MKANAGAATKEDQPGDLHGVSLNRYAGVIAGLSEGLPLPDILRNEGVDPAAWPDAEDAWDDRITDDEDGALQTHFDELLAGAQDRYGRPVKPLEDEVGVWLDFVRHMASAEEPLSFMATLGLCPADVLRLHRRWASLIAGDPRVAAAAFAALGRAPHDLPRLVVGERRIQPPQDGPSTAPSAIGRASSAALDEDDDLDDEEEGGDSGDPGEAALFMPLPGAVDEEASAEASVAPPAPPPVVLRSPETLPPQPELAVSTRAPATPGGMNGESPPDLLRRIAEGKLPFAPAPQAQEEPATLAPQPSPLGRSVLPFSSSAPAPPPPAPHAPRPLAPPELAKNTGAPVSPGGTTGEIPPDLLRRIAAGKLPFARAPAESPQAPHAPAPPSADSALPFRSSTAAGAPRSPAEPVPAQAAAQAGHGGAASPDVGEATLGPAPSPLREVLPFRQAPPQPSSQARPASPQPTAVAPPVQAPAPTLTLEQYASMCAELAVFHDRPEAVFAKYGLADLRHRAAIDAAWKERLRRFPSEKAEWDRRYWQYEASWRRARR